MGKGVARVNAEAVLEEPGPSGPQCSPGGQKAISNEDAAERNTSPVRRAKEAEAHFSDTTSRLPVRVLF